MVDFLAILHYNFSHIRPYKDTNARTARLIMCMFLLRNKYPPIVIDPEDLEEYWIALTLASVDSDLNQLVVFLDNCLVKSYQKYSDEIGKPAVYDSVEPAADLKRFWMIDPDATLYDQQA
jgi:Fic family protein